MKNQCEGGKEIAAIKKSIKKVSAVDWRDWIPLIMMLLFMVVFWAVDSQAWVVFAVAACVILLVESLTPQDKEKKKVE